LATRGAAADEAGGSSAVKGNTMATVEQAVCTGVAMFVLSVCCFDSLCFIKPILGNRYGP